MVGVKLKSDNSHKLLKQHGCRLFPVDSVKKPIKRPFFTTIFVRVETVRTHVGAILVVHLLASKMEDSNCLEFYHGEALNADKLANQPFIHQ